MRGVLQPWEEARGLLRSDRHGLLPRALGSQRPGSPFCIALDTAPGVLSLCRPAGSRPTSGRPSPWGQAGPLAGAPAFCVRSSQSREQKGPVHRVLARVPAVIHHQQGSGALAPHHGRSWTRIRGTAQAAGWQGRAGLWGHKPGKAALCGHGCPVAPALQPGTLLLWASHQRSLGVVLCAWGSSSGLWLRGQGLCWVPTARGSCRHLASPSV